MTTGGLVTASAVLEESQRTRSGLRHFVFLPARGVLESRDAESDYLLNRAIYLQEQMLGQLGCNVIWFRTFEDLPRRLERLCEPLPRPLELAKLAQCAPRPHGAGWPGRRPAPIGGAVGVGVCCLA